MSDNPLGARAVPEEAVSMSLSLACGWTWSSLGSLAWKVSSGLSLAPTVSLETCLGASSSDSLSVAIASKTMKGSSVGKRQKAQLMAGLGDPQLNYLECKGALAGRSPLAGPQGCGPMGCPLSLAPTSLPGLRQRKD